MDQSQVYAQILYLLIFHKIILNNILPVNIEQDNTEEPPSSNSHVEIKFNWDSNVKWTIPQDSLFEKQKLQVKIEQDKRLNVYSSPWS